jgi:hypothetical protein
LLNFINNIGHTKNAIELNLLRFWVKRHASGLTTPKVGKIAKYSQVIEQKVRQNQK